ncbi:MAG: hypothetical protein AAGA73_13150, partial [Pseudomonadota bacterium]
QPHPFSITFLTSATGKQGPKGAFAWEGPGSIKWEMGWQERGGELERGRPLFTGSSPKGLDARGAR